jgi:lipopolysaccharide transport system ATP-binding protein
MLLRLGYAIVANLDDDLLLIDETLSVGDFAFRQKCARHVRHFVEGGGSLLLVSHSVWAVKGLCDRAIVLDHGRVAFEGGAEEAVEHYLEVESLPRTMEAFADPLGTEREPSPVSIEQVRIQPLDDGELAFGAPARIEVDYRSSDVFERASWGFVLWTADGAAAVAGQLTGDDDAVRLERGAGTLRCEIDAFPLARGAYGVRIVVFEAATKVVLGLHGYEDAATQVVVGGPSADDRLVRVGGTPLTRLAVTWSDEPQPSSPRK